MAAWHWKLANERLHFFTKEVLRHWDRSDERLLTSNGLNLICNWLCVHFPNEKVSGLLLIYEVWGELNKWRTLPSRCSWIEQLSMKVWATTDRHESTTCDLFTSKTNSGFLMMFTQNRRRRLVENKMAFVSICCRSTRDFSLNVSLVFINCDTKRVI